MFRLPGSQPGHDSHGSHAHRRLDDKGPCQGSLIYIGGKMNARCSICLLAWILATTTGVAQEPQPTIMIPTKEKFHLYLLMGQSNMAGRGALPTIKASSNPRILVLNKSNEWAVAVDPLHFDKGSAGVGPGLSFAQTMLSETADDSIVIGLVPCAVGGSSLKQWENGGEFFFKASDRARLAVKRGSLKGVLWHQGETDAMKEETATTYSARLARMIGDFRTELGLAEMPFVVGKLSPAIDSSPDYPFSKMINRSEEHTSELQSRFGISYAVFC